MTKVLRKIGHSIGCTFPKTLLDDLKLKEGDQIDVREKDGIIELVPMKRITPIKLGGMGKGISVDIEDIRQIRRDMWKSLGKEP